MNLSATSAPHSSNEAPAACGGPGGSTLPSPSGETTTAASAPASPPARRLAGDDRVTLPHPGLVPRQLAGDDRVALPHPGLVPPDLHGERAHAARGALRQAAREPHGAITGAWDEEEGSGYLLFDREGPVLGRFDVIASPSDLRLELRTTPERAAHLEHVAGIHLARFGARDGLTIAWRRSDGSAGSTQGPLTPDEVEARARERAKRKAAGQ